MFSNRSYQQGIPFWSQSYIRLGVVRNIILGSNYPSNTFQQYIIDLKTSGKVFRIYQFYSGRLLWSIDSIGVDGNRHRYWFISRAGLNFQNYRFQQFIHIAIVWQTKEGKGIVANKICDHFGKENTRTCPYQKFRI